MNLDRLRMHPDNLRTIVFGGLALCIIFIGCVCLYSEKHGLSDNHVPNADVELMAECYAAAESIINTDGPEVENKPEAIAIMATMLYKDTKRTTAFW